MLSPRHPYRLSRHLRRKPGEHTDRVAQGQPLVADLGGGGDGDLVDLLGRQLTVAAEQVAHHRGDEVVGTGVGVQTVRLGAAERRTERVDEHDVTAKERHQDLPVTSVRL